MEQHSAAQPCIVARFHPVAQRVTAQLLRATTRPCRYLRIQQKDLQVCTCAAQPDLHEQQTCVLLLPAAADVIMMSFAALAGFYTLPPTPDAVQAKVAELRWRMDHRPKDDDDVEDDDPADVAALAKDAEQLAKLEQEQAQVERDLEQTDGAGETLCYGCGGGSS